MTIWSKIDSWRRRQRDAVLRAQFGKAAPYIGRGLDYVDSAASSGMYSAGRAGAKALQEVYGAFKPRGSYKRKIKRPGPDKRPPGKRPKPNPKRTPLHTWGGNRGRFNKRGGRPNKRLYRASAVYKFERGGNISASQCLYLGHHSTPFEHTWLAIWMAVVKAMAKQQKMDFDHWDRPVLEGVANLFNIVVRYRDGEVDKPVSNITYTPSAGTLTWLQLAIELSEQILTLVSSGSLKFQLLDMYIKNQSGTTAIINSQKIRFKDMRIAMKCISTLKIQNETVATSVPDTGQDVNNANDIRNNPLEGKFYDIYGNYVSPKFVDHLGGAADPVVLCARSDNGIMIAADSAGNLTPSLQNMYKKILPGGFFARCSKTGRVTLAPGEIKRSSIVTRRTMYFNSIISKLLPQLRATNTLAASLNEQPMDFGKSKLFGFEKMVDSRDTEPSISCGYDISYTFIMTCIGQSGVFTVPYTDVA